MSGRDGAACDRTVAACETDARGARAQTGYALPNEWLFEAFFSIQLLGTDGSGCVYDGTSDTVNGGYLSAWYGDGGSRTAPQLGLFFPTRVTLVPNYLGMGVGNDPSNLALLQAGCSSPGGCMTNWTAVPNGALSWYSNPTPAPYITLPVTAWPTCTGGVMLFNGANYTTTVSAAPVAAASGGRGARAAAGAAALLGTVLAAALAL